jgi:hypothetical protein
MSSAGEPVDADRIPPGPPPPPGEEGPRPLAEAVGGITGILESVLPPITFITAHTVVGLEAATAAFIALGIGAVAAAARIARGQTIQYALAGVAGVGLAAFIVARTGRAEDFFLPGLLANTAYALGCVLSNLVGKPAVGIAIGVLSGDRRGWDADPARVRAYARATWIWAGIFSLRLAVQIPLYLTGALVALGAARVSMGLPLFALGLWLTYLVLRASGTGALPHLLGSRGRT